MLERRQQGKKKKNKKHFDQDINNIIYYNYDKKGHYLTSYPKPLKN